MLFKEIIKQFIPIGVFNIVKNRIEISHQRRFEAEFMQKYRHYNRNNTIKKLHFGCGKNILKGWLNTDINPINKDVLFLDVKEKFPFDNDTFDYIFSEHLIEHLELKDGISMLRECYRILVKGGKIRIATPDLCVITELYNSSRTDMQDRYINWIKNSFFQDIDFCHATLAINKGFSGWGHRFIYDFEVLSVVIKQVGFVDITRCEVGKSRDKNFQSIESHGTQVPSEFNKFETMVVEGIKR